MARSAALIAAICGALCATAALAVSDAQVQRFVRLSDSFNAQLSRSEIAGLSPDQRRVRGQCILEKLEQSFGNSGISAVLDLMQVLATGAEFDDPTVVAFNAQYGGTYNAATRACLATARNT